MGKNVILSLGSNVGDREANINKAIEIIKDLEGVYDVKVSSFYETKAWGFEDQDDFLNMCISMNTDMGPVVLLNQCKDIEVMLGRGESVRWGPRIIDIDIIFFGEDRVESDIITIPHPFFSSRAFVLTPLHELVVNGYVDEKVITLDKLEIYMAMLDRSEFDGVRLYK